MEYEAARTTRLGNRDSNQDRVSILEGEDAVLLLVADGMGGRAGGELAAQTLVESSATIFDQLTTPVANPGFLLRRLLVRGHEAVLEAGRRNPPLTPGTTAVACLIQEGFACWAHVGDSRLYLIRDGEIVERTRDHSYVEQLYQKGKLDDNGRGKHPMRNFVTRCLGLRTNPPEIAVGRPVALQPGDVIVLCSDGFWEGTNEDAMSKQLQDEDLGPVLDKLASNAEEARYPRADNITAAALRVVELDTQATQVPARPIEDPTPVTSTDRLNSAIADIEQALEQYRDEMGA